jgi:hypothetical protein
MSSMFHNCRCQAAAFVKCTVLVLFHCRLTCMYGCCMLKSDHWKQWRVVDVYW